MKSRNVFETIIKKLSEGLRNWKLNRLLEDLQFSYDLRKKIFNNTKMLHMNFDISKMEYIFIKKIGLNFLELIKYFEKLNNVKIAVIGDWAVSEYKPIYMYDTEGRVVYRYSMYFGNAESITEK